MGFLVIVYVVYIFSPWSHYKPDINKPPNPYSDGFEEFCDVHIGEISLANNGEHFTFYTEDPNNFKLPINITCKGLDDYPTDVFKAYINATSPFKKSALFDDLKHTKEVSNGKQIDKWTYYDIINKENLFEFNMTGKYILKFKLDGNKLYYPAIINIKWNNE